MLDKNKEHCGGNLDAPNKLQTTNLIKFFLELS